MNEWVFRRSATRLNKTAYSTEHCFKRPILIICVGSQNNVRTELKRARVQSSQLYLFCIMQKYTSLQTISQKVWNGKSQYLHTAALKYGAQMQIVEIIFS